MKSKVFGLRVPARGVPVLEAAIKRSGHSQAEFFRIAVEAACSRGDIAAASFAAGRSTGHSDASFLLAKFSEQLTEISKRLEKKESGVEAFEIEGE